MGYPDPQCLAGKSRNFQAFHARDPLAGLGKVLYFDSHVSTRGEVGQSCWSPGPKFRKL